MPTPQSNKEEREISELRAPSSDLRALSSALSHAPRRVEKIDSDAMQQLILRGPLTPAVADRALTSHERQEVLERAWTFIDKILTLGKESMEPKPRMIGIEIEGALTRQDGSYAEGAATLVLSKLDRKIWHEEAGSGSIEYASRPVEVHPGALAGLLRSTQHQFQLLTKLAAAQELLVIGTGIIPVLGPDQVLSPSMGARSESEEAISKHWQEIKRRLSPDGQAEASTEQRPTVKLEYGSSAYEMTTEDAAWMTINSLHVTFQTRDHVDALNLFNALRALTPLMMGASCNTGLLNGHALNYQDYRPRIMAGAGSLDFDFSTCCGIVADRAESLRQAYELVMPKKITDQCPAISFKSGSEPSLRDAFESVRESIFPSIQMRFHPQDPGTILIEYRPMSVQLTVDRNVAVATLLLLAADFMARYPHAVRHVTREEFLRDVDHSTRERMQSEVHNPFRCCGPARGTVKEILIAALPILEQHAILSGMVGSSDLAVLDIFRAQVLTGDTSATILRKEVAQHGLAGALARNQLARSSSDDTFSLAL